MTDTPDNFGGLMPEFSSYDKAAVVVLPVPYEGTVSYGKGTAKGPGNMIKASQNMELYDEELDCVPCEIGIHTLKEFTGKNDPEATVKGLREHVKKFVDDDKFLCVLGGEHSISSGYAAALKERYPDLSVLQFDAHSDLRDEFDGSQYSHACVMRRIVEMGCKTAQVGIRSQDSEEMDFIKENSMEHSIFNVWRMRNDPNWMKKMLDCLSDHVFITFDIDGLDPSIMPSTGTPEPGGLTWFEALDILKLVFRHKHVVGFDVVELAPIDGLHAPDFTAAKLAYKMIGYNFFKDRL
ncbi:agmatinase [Candidatus Woesearchaeota archaeon CG11_big_fil_rev_8_21_14_0_20_43_8]|nr:MAG: agmatinase [Candidatus Woesearchaeota archaeon CG11_big_fil_rev_8_21_14_0_20_43_8]PIO07990.1 MAG: agmatinase [Candidatus Woesearchaeota archaeon CG08_land_8_20_14_0_20_43_7]